MTMSYVLCNELPYHKHNDILYITYKYNPVIYIWIRYEEILFKCWVSNLHWVMVVLKGIPDGITVSATIYPTVLLILYNYENLQGYTYSGLNCRLK